MPNIRLFDTQNGRFMNNGEPIEANTLADLGSVINLQNYKLAMQGSGMVVDDPEHVFEGDATLFAAPARTKAGNVEVVEQLRLINEKLQILIDAQTKDTPLTPATDEEAEMMEEYLNLTDREAVELDAGIGPDPMARDPRAGGGISPSDIGL